MNEDRHDALKMPFEHLGDPCDGAQRITRCSFMPNIKEVAGFVFGLASIKVPEKLFDAPRLAGLELLHPQGVKAFPPLAGESLHAVQPELSASFQVVISLGEKLFVFLTTNKVDGFIEMPNQMESIMNNLAVRVGNMLASRDQIGLPHVHTDGFYSVDQFLVQRNPETI